MDAQGKLVGLLPGHVVKQRYAKRKVAEAMTPRAQVIPSTRRNWAATPSPRPTVSSPTTPASTRCWWWTTRTGCAGLFTITDVERITQERNAQFKPARDAHFRLVCGAAVSATRNAFGELDRERILAHVGALVDEALDAVAVSTAHGHSRGVGDMVRLLRDAFPNLPIIAGNVTSAAGVEFLADCGANAIKIGQGPGSICTTRIVAGVGIPQLTALYVAHARRRARSASPSSPTAASPSPATSSRPSRWPTPSSAAACSPAAARRRARSSKSAASSTNNTAAWAASPP